MLHCVHAIFYAYRNNWNPFNYASLLQLSGSCSPVQIPKWLFIQYRIVLSYSNAVIWPCTYSSLLGATCPPEHTFQFYCILSSSKFLPSVRFHFHKACGQMIHGHCRQGGGLSARLLLHSHSVSPINLQSLILPCIDKLSSVTHSRVCWGSGGSKKWLHNSLQCFLCFETKFRDSLCNCRGKH